MNNNLTELATWADSLLNKLNPTQRRQLLRLIAQDLRRNQAHRIASQKAPDGAAYTPRKQRKKLRTKQGRIKQQKAGMFNKLRTTRHLKTQRDASQLSVEFRGRVARIARVHQEGLSDRVTSGGANYAYPQRQLSGLSTTDKTFIRESLLRHLS
jgi:phage virion morphogenesis protein